MKRPRRGDDDRVPTARAVIQERAVVLYLRPRTGNVEVSPVRRPTSLDLDRYPDPGPEAA